MSFKISLISLMIISANCQYELIQETGIAKINDS